jgi:hypothetical protein
MAGDWIPLDKTLPQKPKVSRIARTLGISRADAVLGCLLVWIWADDHTADGVLDGAVLEDVDDAARIKGFGQAMLDVGWLTADARGLTLTNWGQWNMKSAKRRLRDAERKRRDRSEGDGAPE